MVNGTLIIIEAYLPSKALPVLMRTKINCNTYYSAPICNGADSHFILIFNKHGNAMEDKDASGNLATHFMQRI